jgi:nicotinamidase-related amidase
MAESEKSALLVMDVQPGIIDRLNEKKDEYHTIVRSAIDAAHKNHIPVIFVVVGFRPGFPEVSADNKIFQAMQKAGSEHMILPSPAIKPVGDDVLVTKKRISAFTGSDLEVILRAKEIRHLVLAGISTSGVVLSTLREAADKDFKSTVLSDLCADMDEEVHSVLMRKIFPRQADVINSEEWIKLTEK